MKKHVKIAVLLALAAAFWEPVFADEAARQAVIAKIMEAQGVQLMFQQQLEQSREGAIAAGREIFKKTIGGHGISEDKADPRLLKAFERYMERCIAVFSAEEMTAMWSAAYGKNLSEAELAEILAYYQSPIGQKDVASSLAALAEFTKSLLEKTEQRLNDALEQFLADLDAIMSE